MNIRSSVIAVARLSRSGRLCALAITSALPWTSAAAQTAAAPPDAVVIPGALNLGLTNFYDGFAKPVKGLTVMNYVRYASYDRINDQDGRRVSAFDNPKVDVVADVIQAVYQTDYDVLGHYSAGISVEQPILSYRTHFGPNGPALSDNGTGLGDTVVGGFLEAKPIMSGGRPVLAYRVQLDVNVPVGDWDRKADLNQSTRYWSLTPLVAVTVLPIPKLEVSARFNYLYNFRTRHASNPQPYRDPFRNGQAGQAFWVNYTASYGIWPNLALGVNGYWLRQLTNDRYNGRALVNTKKESLYFGPGAHITADKRNILNLNVYLPLVSRGLPSGNQFNAQFLHFF